jgi:bacillithiol system protein YtxJ
MAWLKLNSIEILDKLIEDSHHATQFIFKHSVRCSISSVAMSRLQSAIKKNDIYIIDVINDRDISNATEQKLSVTHQSPQFLAVNGGRCLHHASHMQISPATIEQFSSTQE